MKRRSLFKLLGAVALAPTGLFKATREEWVAQWVNDSSVSTFGTPWTTNLYTDYILQKFTPMLERDLMMDHMARNLAKNLDTKIRWALDLPSPSHSPSPRTREEQVREE